jgi:hypothetical protein
MRYRVSCLIVITLVGGTSAHVLFVGEQPIGRTLAWDMDPAQTMEEFEQATFNVQKRRSELIGFLKRMLRRETDNEKKIRICYLLGEYRATEAINDLTHHITLEADVKPFSTEIPRWFKYPAQEALVKCGTRSVPPMILNLETSNDELVRELSATVIWHVIGAGLPREIDGRDYARMIVQNAIDKQSDPVKKEKLQAALGLFVVSKRQREAL